MKFELKHFWTGKVIFTAEINCEENERESVKIGLAVKVAVEAKARLVGARLDGARLVVVSVFVSFFIWAATRRFRLLKKLFS